MSSIISSNEHEVKVAATVAPRDFSTGSVGYGVYEAVQLGGIRHQLTANIVVNGSKKWTPEDRKAWIDLHTDKVNIELVGHIDVFKSTNTGWRFNYQTELGGERVTVSGALILSNKTVAAASKKAEKINAKIAKEKAAVTAHAKALKALKDSLKPVPKSHTLASDAE